MRKLTADTITDADIYALRAQYRGSSEFVEGACKAALERGAHTFIADVRRARAVVASLINASVRCPHCGNINRDTIQNNGGTRRDGDLTYLCVARVRVWSFDHVKPSPEDFDAAGLVPCGMQWDAIDEEH